MRFLVPPCALALVVLFLQTTRSQPGQVKDGKYVTKLTVSPAAPPVPALRYTLLPHARDARPGNQVQGFYKCFFEQNYLFHNKEVVEQREKWGEAPLAELRGVKELVGYGGAAVRQAVRAARMESVDWQVATDVREDGFMLLLPDVQELRNLARVLRVRARGEIARGEFDAALETIQTMFALARSFNEHPTLIASLVGSAIAATALATAEELVAQPGAPNLFWALADLPSPLFDLRKAVHGERVFLTAEFDRFIDRKNPMTEAQLAVAVTKVTEVLDLVAPPKHALAPAKGEKVVPPPPRPMPPVPAKYLGDRAADPKQVAEARARLMPAPPVQDERIAKFPPLQVILVDELNRFEASRDDMLKWLTVPVWQVPGSVADQGATGLFAPLAPAVFRVAFVRGRLQQQVAMLQVAEGLRAYSAANGGRFPASLGDVKLPLPNDPFTNKPFVYELANGMAVIRGTPPEAAKQDPMLNRVYEITLRK